MLKIRNWIVAALMVPAIAAAQGRASFDGKPMFERMQASVAKIAQVPEKQRWQANVAMWQTVLASPEALSLADIASLKASLLTIETNVATIERPEEAARWRANVALWRAFIAGDKAKGTRAMAAKDSVFARMKANVLRIVASDEKERWQANVDLWKAMLTVK
jgi:hypothetical protein